MKDILERPADRATGSAGGDRRRRSLAVQPWRKLRDRSRARRRWRIHRTVRTKVKGDNHARSCSLRSARCAFRGARRAEDHRADRCRHPDLGHLRVRVRPVALSRHQPIAEPTPMGHEYCGIVEEVGSAVTSIKPGQFVIGSFFASDNTCPHCRAGYQSSCQHREFISTRAGADAARAARGRHAWWPRQTFPRRPDSEPAGGLGRPRHRLVRRRRSQREAGHRRSRSSATARSASSVCSPPSRWVPSGSSR